jgi:hypothetical protein
MLCNHIHCTCAKADVRQKKSDNTNRRADYNERLLFYVICMCLIGLHKSDDITRTITLSVITVGRVHCIYSNLKQQLTLFPNTLSLCSSHNVRDQVSYPFKTTGKNTVLYILIFSRSQWPRGLRHELSSLPRTLGSWVRIPLKAWMSVCVYSVCRYRPYDGLMPRSRSPTDCV